MKRQEKADKIGKMLDRLYPETPVPLDHSDPYTLLVAVMLSAQTTDKKVNEGDSSLVLSCLEPKRDGFVGGRNNSVLHQASWPCSD